MALGTDANRVFVIRTPLLETQPSADLVLTQTESPNPVSQGGNVTYSFAIANNGPWTATGVIFTNVLPSGVSYLSASASQGAFSQTNGPVVCNIGTLFNGASATVTVVALASSLATVTNVAMVGQNQQDTNPTDNFSTSITTINAQPIVSINDLSLREGNQSTTTASFSVRLSAPSSQTVTVNYSTADGTAIAGSDYITNSGSLMFPPGVTNRSLNARIFGDTLIEPNETFFVNLTGATNATLGTSQGICTILNDDTYSITTTNASVVEGNSGIANVVFNVKLSAPSSQTVAVDYWTVDSSAKAGRDYGFKSGTLIFQPGITNKVLSIAVYGNALNEIDKKFILFMANPVNATLNADEVDGTIVNDDPPPPFTITSWQWLGADLHIYLGGAAGALYQLERSDDLGVNVWITVADNIQGTDATVECTDPSAAARPQSYYRIKRLQ